jgi:hypothetical protein
MEKLLPGDPAALLHQFLMHQQNLPGGSAESQERTAAD